MAIKYVFESSSNELNDNIEMECFYNARNEISIVTTHLETRDTHIVSLDKKTAVKFAKVLRSEIYKIED